MTGPRRLSRKETEPPTHFSIDYKELHMTKIVRAIRRRKEGGRRSGRLYGVVGLVAALSAVGLGALTTPASAMVAATTAAQINGTGSSFAAPAINTWVKATGNPPYSLHMNYSATNSGTGRFEFTNQTTDWAVSDIGYVGDTDTTPPSFPFNFIPITAGGIAFMYNVPGLTKQLQLSSFTACALLTGGITNWDSPTLAADNPGVTLPNLPVVAVTESDSAGTNYVLEEWCIDEQPALWAAFVHQQQTQSGGPTDGVSLSPTSPNSNWPGIAGGLNEQLTAAVAGDVSTTAGAVGPVQVKYAEDEAGFSGSNPAKNVALVKNASGDYTAPTPVDVASALAYAAQLPDGTHKLDFAGAGPNVYNPSTYSYLLTPTTGWPAAKGETLSEFVNYVLTLGQQSAPSFGYASLGLSLEQYGINAVLKNVPGAVSPTAAEQSAYSCGDLTPAEVQAGAKTPTCGVVTVTAPPPSANGGTATGTAVTSPAGGTKATTGTTAGTTAATSGGTTSTKGGVTTSPNKSTGSSSNTTGSSSNTSGTTADALGGSSSGDPSTQGSTSSGGVDPAVSLSGTAAMPNTGGDPVPLTLVGGGLLVIGCIGRRRVLARRRGAVR
jgi:phosphate transport system substrate-binding protein